MAKRLAAAAWQGDTDQAGRQRRDEAHAALAAGGAVMGTGARTLPAQNGSSHTTITGRGRHADNKRTTLCHDHASGGCSSREGHPGHCRGAPLLRGRGCAPQGHWGDTGRAGVSAGTGGGLPASGESGESRGSKPADLSIASDTDLAKGVIAVASAMGGLLGFGGGDKVRPDQMPVVGAEVLASDGTTGGGFD